MLRGIRIRSRRYMTGMYIDIVGRMRSGRSGFSFSSTTMVYVVAPDPLGVPPPPACSSPVVARRSISSTSRELVLEERE